MREDTTLIILHDDTQAVHVFVLLHGHGMQPLMPDRDAVASPSLCLELAGLRLRTQGLSWQSRAVKPPLSSLLHRTTHSVAGVGVNVITQM